MKTIALNLFICAFLICGIQAALKTTFIEDLCYRTMVNSLSVRYEGSGILMSVPRHGNEEFACELTLIPERGHSLVLSMYRYDVNEGDTLIIEDSDRHKISLIGWQSFKDEKKSIISDGKIIIKYLRNSTSKYPGINSRSGFQFTYTQVYEFPDGKCHDKQFHCKNNKCIQKHLACDGHNHCGDNSDQISCVPETSAKPVYGHNTSRQSAVVWISAITIAASILVIIIIVFIAVIIRGRIKRRKTMQEQGEQTGGDIPMQSSPANVENGVSPQQVPPVQNPEPERESFYYRVRRSLRGQKKTNVEEEPTQRQETFEVPSMYPSLDQVPSAPLELNGAENPAFNNQE